MSDAVSSNPSGHPTARDPLVWAIVAALLVSIAAIAFAALAAESPGTPHPEFPSMARGGAAPGTATRFLGWLLGAAQIVFFAACFGLGLRRGGAVAVPRPVFGLALVWQAAWVLFMSVDALRPATVGVPIVLGFPVSTALLLYLLWPLPLIFVAYWIADFDRLVLSSDEEARFEAELSALREQAEAEH